MHMDVYIKYTYICKNNYKEESLTNSSESFEN